MKRRTGPERTAEEVCDVTNTLGGSGFCAELADDWIGPLESDSGDPTKATHFEGGGEKKK